MNARWQAQALMVDPVEAFLEACALDVASLKPGNVSHEAPGHGMTAEDFLASAHAASAFVADPALAVGERIYWAVDATQRHVGCNTNLGILLLTVPLIHAAQQRAPGESVHFHLAQSLEGFDLEQTDWVYRAIRLAAPGGLGKSARHDVHTTPSAPLLAGMQEAQRRDCIARQYANGFTDIFNEGRRALSEGRQRWQDETAAVSTLFMAYLSTFPDSHIQRKQGIKVAGDVRQMARICLEEIQACPSWAAAHDLLLELDTTLKAAGINPGTSADLTVATWLADRLDSAVSEEAGPEP